jgi:hypothetical protein
MNAAEELSTPSLEQRPASIGALAAAQGFDVSTTLYGLRSPNVVEANPVAASAMARLGTVPGLLCLAVLAVLTVVAVTETAARRCEGTTLTPGRVRCLGYLPHVAISLAVGLHNLSIAL